MTLLVMTVLLTMPFFLMFSASSPKILTSILERYSRSSAITKYMLIEWIRRASYLAAMVLMSVQTPAGAIMLSSGPDEAAKKGWEVLKRLDATKQADDDELAKALGFASAQQASQSQLGRALQVFRVGL